MMKEHCRQGLLWLLLFVTVMAACPAYSAQSGPVILEIPAVIYTSKGTIRLGEVAKITGGMKRTRDILANVQVWTDGQTLERREVMRAVEASDVSGVRLEIRMPLSSRIEPPDYEGNFTDPSPRNERSVNDLVPTLKNMAGWTGGLEISASSPVPEGRLVDPTTLIPGTSGATLRFQDSSGRVRPLNVRLTWTQNVLVAARNIKRGDRINPQALFTRPMKITRAGVYPSSPAEVSGFTANRNIKQGEALEFRYLTSSQVIKRGRQVKIIARFNGVSATTDGVLMEDGRPGDWVKVRRADDRRATFRARIIDENTVEVSTE
ncbi:MAG: flagellar basal body P-ring formation protein FlgA [Synergistaceae bacterium]|nr:flagellar basal body P-ring formation protein FlgA [Synergistaceae bacterium]